MNTQEREAFEALFQACADVAEWDDCYCGPNAKPDDLCGTHQAQAALPLAEKVLRPARDKDTEEGQT